ncbi:phosphoenolpyruvate--protein phosphotransferase [Spirochaeta isovalerica]|uniref:Phosphoenolpyruvate-protein phosphotransferase n=1 Tax=Spirochaeta isovalerica TaxID=150 RepID=A0A841REE5_9SPIO|nr:phosphoenolpyruvate--protein phosphotransferase [Spirochaeta isovalerica]MBB6481751.1 phosphoenolpyruvate-protein phosphotransferase [Spirochaeta isovalerica]
MKKNPLFRFLDTVCGEIALFETTGEVDRFFKDSVRHLMKISGASLGAIFGYNELEDEPVFRVGFDSGDFWDSLRCSREGLPVRFSLDKEEVDRAFREGTVRLLGDVSGKREDSTLQSKIIVPFLRGNGKNGILLLGHRHADAFSHMDKASVMEAASLFSDRLSDALVFINHPVCKLDQEISGRMVLKGMKTSEGIASGKALPEWSDMETAAESLQPAGTKEKEAARFEQALELSLRQLAQYQDSAASGESEIVSMIFTAQIYMLKDHSFISKMRALINEGREASHAVCQVINEYADRFASMTEIRFAEKAQDVRDLGFRLISNMSEDGDKGFSYEGRIVLCRHIYPSDLFRLAVEKASGIVLKGSGVTAHISILARSLDVPVLICEEKTFLTIPEGTDLILDAGEGKLYINPHEEDRTRLLAETSPPRRSENINRVHGCSADGIPVRVMANINILNDAREAVRQGAEGIGLYRSEFPFILKNDFLLEEQQYRIYRAIVKSQQGKPVILRTADIGGDKLLEGRSETEMNPFLGVRGIRFSLANRGMFREQLKAMLRAGDGADLGIMLPMVSSVEEVLEAKEEISICAAHLEARGVAFQRNPKIGAMVELPSAAMSVGDLARETDFLSIGTNDLIMYLLAVDRTNENLSYLYRCHHPAVLRVLATIAGEAGDKIQNLSVCGDVASDPLMVPFFVGIGIRNLSVSPYSVEPVKQILKRYTISHMERISREMLSINRQKEMDEFIGSFTGL